MNKEMIDSLESLEEAIANTERKFKEFCKPWNIKVYPGHTFLVRISEIYKELDKIIEPRKREISEYYNKQ